MYLQIDSSFAGISGKKLLSALIDLSNQKLDAIFLSLKEYFGISLEYSIENKYDKGFAGILFNADFEQVSLTIIQIESGLEHLIKQFNLENPFDDLARQALRTLIIAESRTEIDDELHTRELHSLKVIVEIFIPLYIMYKLEIESISFSAVALGEGTVNVGKNTLPVPVPMVNEIINHFKIPTISGPKGGEATNPIGVALIASLLKLKSGSDNEIIWENHGIGFGNQDWEDRSDILRIRLGKKNKTLSKIIQLETNIDDTDSEKLAFAMNQLIENGALDVSYLPVFMKKNRPAYQLQVICKHEDLDKLSELILKHTNTLGIRILEINRHIGSRKILEVQISIFNTNEIIHIKKGKYTVKIEFNDLKALSKKYQVSIMKLEKLIYGMPEIQKILGDLK